MVQLSCMSANNSSSTVYPRTDPFSQDCLDLFKVLSVDSLLHMILQISSAQTDGCYCVCGLLNENGKDFAKYQVYGLTASELNFSSDSGELPVKSLRSDDVILTEDIKDCQKYRIFQSEYPVINSLLYVPINFDERRIGSIALMNKIGAPCFSEDDRILVERLAVYAGLAINNALLYEKSAVREKALAKRNEDLALLNELGRISTSSDGKIDHLIESIMDPIMDYLDIEVGEFFLNTEENPQEYSLMFKAGHNYSTSILGFSTVELGEGLIGRTIENRKPHIFSEKELGIINEKNAVRVQLNSMVILPIIANEGGMGALCLGTRIQKGQEPLDPLFLASIASWIAPLVENQRLTRQQQRVAILEERERIGMDLHDGVIQSIYGVGLTLENARLTAISDPEKTAQTIKLSIEALNSTIRDIRSYIMNLKPDKLTHENIIQSMRRLANDFHANSFVTTEFTPKIEHVEALTDEQTNTFYLICKEGLSNIAKHAHASKVTVHFTEMGNRFVLLIQDNGDGFDTEKSRPATSHGVSNMFTRTRGLGGDIDITSVKGKGTTVIAWLPYLAPGQE